MFVDSIVLILDAFLPLFLVRVYFAQVHKIPVSNRLYVPLSLCFCVVLGLLCYPALATAFAGFGIELGKILGLLIGWVFFLYVSKTGFALKHTNLCISFICITWFTWSLVELAFYLQGQWQVSTIFFTTILGSLVGLMIAWSIHILLHLLLENCPAIWTRLLTACFCAGLLSQSVNLLAQVDVIPEYNSIRLLGSFVTDESLLGALLIVFLGVKSTVSSPYVIVYLSIFVITYIALLNGTVVHRAVANSTQKAPSHSHLNGSQHL